MRSLEDILYQFPMSKSLCIRYYQLLYTIPAVYTLMLIYANHWTREELFWSKERQILTVTSTFAFNREMRWVWLWLIQFVSVMMLSNVRTVSRHFTFLCERFNVSHSWCYLLKTSFIVWPLSLSAIVIFIQGDAPRMNRVSNISPLIWTMHYVFVLMMVVGVFGVMISIHMVLKKCPNNLNQIQKAHRFTWKRMISTSFAFCAFAMIGLGVAATLKDPMGESPDTAIFWDLMTAFEYISILLLMLFAVDVFAGVRKLEELVTSLDDRMMTDSLTTNLNSFDSTRKNSMTPIL